MPAAQRHWESSGRPARQWRLLTSSRKKVVPENGYGLIFALLTGSLIGALSALASALLMLFKDLRHGHIFPDYPPEMMLAMLERFALSGRSPVDCRPASASASCSN